MQILQPLGEEYLCIGLARPGRLADRPALTTTETVVNDPVFRVRGVWWWLHRCSVKAVDLIVGEEGSERATSSVLIGLSRLSEKEEMPWPDDSVSESATS